MVLLLAVLVSARAKRTILSTAVLFLVAGFVLGEDSIGVIDLHADTSTVGTLAELALFAVLFTDGMRVGWSDLRSAWQLPGRALGWGLPLTLAIMAAVAHWLVGLPWPESLLLAAILSPTDPVFASALVGNEQVPGRLRHLLNVESGVNDGLALPFVIVFLAVAARSHDLHLGRIALEVAGRLAIGVVVPMVAILLSRARFFGASPAYEPLNGLAIGLLVLALAQVSHANLFLAGFVAGVTVATCGPGQRQAFEQFGENIAELLKLAALLVFGAVLSVGFLGEVSWQGWVFAFVAIFLARPIALWVSFLGSDLDMGEQAAAMWFGPKGFASVVYGLLVLNSGIGLADPIVHLVAVTIVVSIVLHSSTDVLVARRFDTAAEAPHWHAALQRGSES
ncbi:cation:proton antiporter [Actinoplanes sp. NPDC026623]|uniref:cation:proton antiporter n=1 Tax=Actinoplanes sp. NPDC026623 TaxID=3155610 RepID=UPI0033CF99B2